MSTRRYDRQTVIEGKLDPLPKNPNAAWADPVLLHDGPRSITSMRALHVMRSDGQREITLTLRKFTQPDAMGYFGAASKISLDPNAVTTLCSYLRTQESLRDVALGSHYLIADGQQVSAETADSIATLISTGKLTETALANIHASAQHAAYLSALRELQELLDTDDSEDTYQKWFTKQPWVFGTSYVGRVDKRVVGLHEQVDIILKTADGYLDIIELKKPSMEPLRPVKHGQKTFWCWSADVSQAVGQCADYLRCVEEKRHELQADEGLPFIKPRARVVIGRTQHWEPGKHAALRTLNAALHGVEVWTYDHVLTMARQLVACYESSCPEPGLEQYEDDEDPFGDQ